MCVDAVVGGVQLRIQKRKICGPYGIFAVASVVNRLWALRSVNFLWVILCKGACPPGLTTSEYKTWRKSFVHSWNSGTQHSRLFFPFCVVRPQVQTKKGPVRGIKFCTCGCTPATTASTHNRKDRPYITSLLSTVLLGSSL